MGRATQGVRGSTLVEGDEVIGMDAIRQGADVLVVTEKGFGKRTPVEEYRITARGGKGIKTLQLTERNGPIVGVKVLGEEDEVMLISREGVMIRMLVRDVSRVGRATQGVRLMRLGEGDQVVALAQVMRRAPGEGEE